MVERIRNIAFIVVMAAGLCSVLGYLALSTAFPGQVNRPVESSLENRSYVTLDDVLAKSFVRGTAQDKFEQFAADNVPARDKVLLFNGDLQRKQIAASSKLFGFDAYPTFYGSNVCEVPSKGMLVHEVMPAPDENSAALNAWIRTLNNAAANHPDVRFSFAAICETRQSGSNPTYALQSGELMDREWAQRNIIDRLDERLHAKLFDAESVDEMKELWYSSDVHYTLEYALTVYNEVARQLGLKEVEYKDDVKVVKSWYGGYARKGLDMRHANNLKDLPTDFSHLKYYEITGDKKSKEESAEPGKRAATMLSDKKKMKQTNPFQGYTTYYGTFNGLIVNKNKNKNGKNCLLIGDSFTHCLKRYVADNYKKTYSILPGNFETKRSLEKYIKKYDIDDVIVITQALKYNPIATVSPKFIKLGKNAIVEESDEAGQE